MPCEFHISLLLIVGGSLFCIQGKSIGDSPWQRFKRQAAPPSLFYQPSLPIGPLAVNDQDDLQSTTTLSSIPAAPLVQPVDPCDEAINDQSENTRTFRKLIKAFRKCSSSGANKQLRSISDESRTKAFQSESGSFDARKSNSADEKQLFNAGSGMTIGGVEIGRQFNVDKDKRGNVSVKDKKGIKGIYEEENEVKGGKDFSISSKKCVAGIFCTKTGIDKDGLTLG